jgi:hypothetical protein
MNPGNAKLNKQLIIEWVKKTGKVPRVNKNDTEESRLACRMYNYCVRNKTTYDPNFKKLLINKFGYRSKISKAGRHELSNKEIKERLIKLLNFVKQTNRLPSILVPNEIQLLKWLSAFKSNRIYKKYVNKILKTLKQNKINNNLNIFNKILKTKKITEARQLIYEYCKEN